MRNVRKDPNARRKLRNGGHTLKLDPLPRLMQKGNTAVSENAGPDSAYENEVNFPKREVLIPNTNRPGRSEWGTRERRQTNRGD